MGKSERGLAKDAIVRHWLPLGVIALIAVFAGLLLPRLLPATDLPQIPPSTKTTTSDLTYSPPAWPEQPDHQGMFLRLGLGTLSVLGLCAATLWLCKNWLKGPSLNSPEGSQLQLVETLQLGNRCQVHLIHVDKRPVLIGTDASGVKTVVPLPEIFSIPEMEETTAPGVARAA